MATYIPNVTDTFPEIQPFRPDYGFLQSALQYKQSKFDAAFNQLNSVYGSILNAPLTRGINQERRDEFIKAADAEVKKITSLDLSLPQNVQMASNVFKPFYEDKNIVKDMTWTKGWTKEAQLAETYRNCTSEECKDKYWDTGVKALQYQRQEFAGADDTEALRMGTARYTPYVNVYKKALDYAANANNGKGFNIQTGPDLNGRFLVTHKNGKNAVAPIMSYISLLMKDDPEVRNYYKTKEYVEFKDFVATQTPILGSEEAAEKAYADAILNSAPKEYNQFVSQLKSDYRSATNRVGVTEGLIKSEGIIPGSDEHKDYLEALKEQDFLKAAVQKADLETYNLEKIDNYVARARALKKEMNMVSDFTKSANVAAYINTSTDVKVNPYALEDYKQRNRIAIEKFKKELDTEESKARLLTIPTTPGGDVDLGEAVNVNRSVIAQAKQNNINQMVDFINRVSGVQGAPVIFDGKEISAAELRSKALDPNNRSKILDMFNESSMYVTSGSGKNDTDLTNLYRTISETTNVINEVDNKFKEGFENAFRSFESTEEFNKAKDDYFNINNVARNGKPVSEQEYINSYIEKYKASQAPMPGRSVSPLMGGSTALGFGTPSNMRLYEQQPIGEEALRERASDEYRKIMSSVSKFYDKNSVYSAYNDLYASGQVNLGTGQMNVGATEILYDPSKNNPIAQSQMQALINSYKRNPNEVLLRIGDASEKGEGAATDNGLKLRNVLDNTLLDAVTASKGEGRYVTNIQYQPAVAGDPNMSSYQINLSDDAIKRIKETDSDLYEQIQNGGGKISVQVPKQLDQNPLQSARQTIDPIKTRVNLSPTGSYTFAVENGGYATIKEISDNNVILSGMYKVYDPITGNYNELPVHAERNNITPGGYTAIYNNLVTQLNNYAVQNLRQKRANLATNGVKDPNALK